MHPCASVVRVVSASMRESTEAPLFVGSPKCEYIFVGPATMPESPPRYSQLPHAINIAFASKPPAPIRYSAIQDVVVVVVVVLSLLSTPHYSPPLAGFDHVSRSISLAINVGAFGASFSLNIPLATMVASWKMSANSGPSDVKSFT
ncbi:PREDICTED: uncharacterized protein LOC106747138 [Dinoponera quadriceps]|uniref:Uncharacterized protein LOC106747138 n=1 Tax=Dinoponera quadriceps TaxID=609295 RepID=A0A6P3XNB3_DINQU|nr:PREDICTED: uncharacterized protein LOC106747138 [Dinoponera quadriceps]